MLFTLRWRSIGSTGIFSFASLAVSAAREWKARGVQEVVRTTPRACFLPTHPTAGSFSSVHSLIGRPNASESFCRSEYRGSAVPRSQREMVIA